MADAKLTIKLEDGGGTGGGGGNSLDADMLARWKALFDAMDKSAKDLADKFDKIKPGGGGGGGGGGGKGGSGVGAYQKALAALNGDPIGPAGRSFSEIAAASMNAPAGSYGRPADATDEEWAFYQLENNRRAVKAAKQAENLRKKAQADQKRMEAEAERLRKEQEAEQDRLAAEKAAEERAYKQRVATYAGPIIGAMAGQSSFAGAGRAVGGTAGSAFGDAAGGALGARIGGTIGLAAGPIGAAIGAALGAVAGETVGKVIDFVLSPFENMQRALNFMGEAAKKVAGNDGFGLVQQGLEGTASVLENIPIAGTFAAGALRTVGTAAKVAVDTLNAFAERGKELSMYSGTIAVAQAQQDVYKTLADLREAQRFGGGYARAISAQTQFEASMRGLLLPVKELALRLTPALIDKLSDNIIIGAHALGKMVGLGELTKEMALEAARERKLAKALEAIDAWTTFFPAGPLPTMPIGTSGPTGGPLGLPVGGPGGSPFPVAFVPPGAP